MNFLIVSGSHRNNSQSLKVANWLAASLELKEHKANVIDLAGNALPLWDDTAWTEGSALSQQVKLYMDRVGLADGLVFIAPEWHGMVPAGLKNFLLYMNPKIAGHKPCLLVGVSASRGGVYPVMELRISGYKNSRITFIPEQLVVQDVINVMNEADVDTGSAADQYIKKRAYYALDVLISYTKALKTMRESGSLLHPDYPNGM